MKLKAFQDSAVTVKAVFLQKMSSDVIISFTLLIQCQTDSFLFLPLTDEFAGVFQI